MKNKLITFLVAIGYFHSQAQATDYLQKLSNDELDSLLSIKGGLSGVTPKVAQEHDLCVFTGAKVKQTGMEIVRLSDFEYRAVNVQKITNTLINTGYFSDRPAATQYIYSLNSGEFRQLLDSFKNRTATIKNEHDMCVFGR